MANEDLVLQRPQKKKCQRGKSKQAVQPSAYVLCGEHGGFIQDDYISVCFQCPNQTANSSLLIYTKVCPLPRSSLCYIKVCQGGYRQQRIHTFDSHKNQALFNKFYQSTPLEKKMFLSAHSL